MSPDPIEPVNLQSTVNKVGERTTQILHFVWGEKRTFEHVKSSSIKQWEFTKMQTKDGRLLMVNTKNVLMVEVFTEPTE